MTIILERIRLRRDTAANWTSNNPTLANAEPGYETDTGKIKLGDGTTAWTALAYRFTGGGVSDGDKGDITVSATGDTWTIDNGVVTLAKQADVATGTIFYRKTAGAGIPEVQTLATLKTDLGLTGTNSGDQTTIVGIAGTLAEFNAALTGADFATGGGTATGANTGDQTITLTSDVTGSGTGSFAATIAANAVTDAKFRQSAALSVVGRSANSTGNVADMAAGTDGHVLRRSGTTLGFGTVATGGITDNAVTLAKLAQVATATFLGRTTAATGNVEALSATQATALLNPATAALKGLLPASTTTKTAFTPRLAIGGSSTGITYSAQNGFYTKIGDLVTVSIRIILTSKGAGSGSVTIEDLPFTVGANGAAPALILSLATSALATCLPNNTTTSILLYAATFSQLAASDLTNNTSFYITASYMV